MLDKRKSSTKALKKLGKYEAAAVVADSAQVDSARQLAL